MTLKVRPLQSADRKPWQALWADYNAFYGRSGNSALSSKVIETTWKRLLDPSEPIAGLVAEREGILVGLAHVVFHRNLIQIEDTCYLQDLFTAPEARGMGVASALIRAVCRLCLEKGHVDLYWHAHETNAPARRLYDRLAQNTEFLVYRIKPLSGRSK